MTGWHNAPRWSLGVIWYPEFERRRSAATGLHLEGASTPLRLGILWSPPELFGLDTRRRDVVGPKATNFISVPTFWLVVPHRRNRNG